MEKQFLQFLDKHLWRFRSEFGWGSWLQQFCSFHENNLFSQLFDVRCEKLKRNENEEMQSNVFSRKSSAPDSLGKVILAFPRRFCGKKQGRSRDRKLAIKARIDGRCVEPSPVAKEGRFPAGGAGWPRGDPASRPGETSTTLARAEDASSRAVARVCYEVTTAMPRRQSTADNALSLRAKAPVISIETTQRNGARDSSGLFGSCQLVPR